jgi:hypothetical protein
MDVLPRVDGGAPGNSEDHSQTVPDRLHVAI